MPRVTSIQVIIEDEDCDAMNDCCNYKYSQSTFSFLMMMYRNQHFEILLLGHPNKNFWGGKFPNIGVGGTSKTRKLKNQNGLSSINIFYSLKESCK